MTPKQIIDSHVRYITSDTGTVKRNEDDELLGYVNDGMAAISMKAPVHFTRTGLFDTVQGATEQALAGVGVQMLLMPERMENGDALLPFDVAQYDAFMPSWRSAPEGVPVNWAPASGRLGYYLHPSPSLGMRVLARYVAKPAVLALNDEITEIPESLIPALINYTIYRAESKDDEHVNSGRAVAHYTLFNSAFGGAEGAP